MKIFLPSKKSLLFILILLFGQQISKAQTVIVPPGDNTKASPLVFNTSTAKDGKAIYDMSCLSCHGTPGQGNYLKGLNPPPADLGTAKIQSQTDGAFFYKISEGNTVMPKFKTTLTETDRWKLVAYIRSFNSKYIQPAIQQSAGNLLSKAVRVDMKYDQPSNQIYLKVSAVIKNDTVLLKGTEVLLFVKRYFGNLQIGSSIKTNDQGIATIDFPKNIPGDKEGYLNLETRINDAVYGEIISSKKLKAGIPTDKPGLTAKRAMWNIESKAPIWLLITFFSIVTCVWLTIGYIIFNIYRIKRISKKIIN
jgi:cytochrome c553